MYEYKKEKQRLFTEQGQVMLLEVMDNIQEKINQSGAVMMKNAISNLYGDNWLHFACVDRLVELKRIVEVTNAECDNYQRVFVLVIKTA